ncbi:hypothetical protein BH10BAC4_BH10BAC4_05420 [soil metagenome]
MSTNNQHKELLAKRNKLLDISSILKDRFIGLESIVDEVTSLLMPWYLFPEAHLRPTVINLWGLTGSGKTALVQSFVELLGHKKLYTHLDMGEFESDSASWIKNILTDDLEYFHEKQAIICLDEFQFAKTMDEKRELGKDKLRVVWELLDSGKINYIPGHSTYYLFRADACLIRLDNAIRRGVTLSNGEVVTEKDAFIELMDSFYFEDRDRDNEPLDHRYLLSRDFIEGVFWLFEDNTFSRDAIRKRVISSTLPEVIELIMEGMKTRTATRQLDLSRSVIFVLGNLDEAYRMSHSLNPDISADDLNEATSKITLSDIKKALSKRFRSEQIARLGNNHIIYKSFTKAQFRELIKRELKRVRDFVMSRFDWNVYFDATVIDIVYAEGVFPSQGTRPVFTTIKNMIESRIGRLALEVIEQDVVAAKIEWSYKNEQFYYTIKDANGDLVHSFAEQVKFKTENLRKSTNPQIQAHTAVHESGHAILAALTLRIVPSVVVSKTASCTAEGFCWVNFPDGPMTKESLTKDIIITLGGYVAEKLIFGDAFTSSGVGSDIQNASELANQAIRQYAMGADPIRIAVKVQENEDLFFHSEGYSQEALRIIKACQQRAEEILQRNKLLLLKMADYLTSHSRMEESQIAAFVKEYSVESWVGEEGFIDKANYYQFHDQIVSQINEYQKEERRLELMRQDPCSKMVMVD